MKSNQITFKTIQISLEDVKDVLIVSKSANVICNMTLMEWVTTTYPPANNCNVTVGELVRKTYKVLIHKDVFNFIKLSKQPVDGILEIFPIDKPGNCPRGEDLRPLHRFIPLSIIYNFNGSSKIPSNTVCQTPKDINSSYETIINSLINNQ